MKKLNLNLNRHLIILAFALSFLSGDIYGQLNVRAMGMGGIFITSGPVRDALFYNPARLVEVNEFELLILDANVGTNGYQFYEKYEQLNDPDDYVEVLQALYGDHIWVGAFARTQVTLPNFSIAYYDHLSIDLGVENPVIPELQVKGQNDIGFAIGGAYSITDSLHVGATLKRLERRGVNQNFGPSYISQLDPEAILDEVGKPGLGLGADLGVDYLFGGSLNPRLSMVWRDVGDTSYSPENKGDKSPPNQASEMALGFGLEYTSTLLDIYPALEYRYLNDDDMDITKKIHLGVEFDFPILDLRVGLNQGYLSYGFGIDIGFFNIQAASYGEELGAYAGQKEDRRYMIQFSIDLGFGLDFNLLSDSDRRKNKQRR